MLVADAAAVAVTRTRLTQLVFTEFIVSVYFPAERVVNGYVFGNLDTSSVHSVA